LNYATFNFYAYLRNCTEIWTYDETYGAWIAYEIKDDAGNTIYKFSIELPTTAAIPGYDLVVFLGITAVTSVGIIYLLMKKKRQT
jgi:hypothetical protein